MVEEAVIKRINLNDMSAEVQKDAIRNRVQHLRDRISRVEDPIKKEELRQQLVLWSKKLQR